MTNLRLRINLLLRRLTSLQTSSKPSSALQASTSPFKDELGAQMPLGFWDPMQMLGSDDARRFNRLREVEIKHGRIGKIK